MLVGSRKGRYCLVDLRHFFLLLAAAAAAVCFAIPGVAFAAPTVVSLSFDDGWDSQQTAATMLAAHGLTGTFYVNSANIGQPGYLTWGQVATMNAGGNEIGGHTLTHPDLTTLTATQAQHEICDDRTNILAHGLVVPDFAYPFGAYDANTGAGSLDVSSIVKGCGYASGRGAFGLHNITSTSDTRPYATTIPPPNLYKILVACCINHASFGGSTPTAAALQSYVQHAESGGGGWVNLFFHRLCDNCGDDDPAPSMSPSEFNSFLDWLAPTSSGAVVKTVAQVIKNDTQAPTSSIACGGGACSTGWYSAPVSVSLSAADTGSSGVAMIRYTTDGSEPTASSPLYSGPFTVSAATTVKYRAWDNASNVEPTKSSRIQVDTTPPVSAIACNGWPCSGWYGAGVSVSLSASDTDSGVAVIRYTTDGSDPTSSSPAYTAPFTLFATATVKYRAWDNAGNVEATQSRTIQVDTAPPVSAIACNGSPCAATAYSADVTVTLSAADGESGVSVIRYTLDGSDPTASSTAYSNPITVSATTTVKYRAWDNAGNVEPPHTQLITITTTTPDTDPPSSSIACDLSVCSNSWYGGAVNVSLSASDGGSGVASVHYTTDGTDPTLSSLTYTAPFSVSTTTTVKYRAWDNAGNVEPTKSQLIQIDTTAAVSAITCNGSTCPSAWFNAPVSIALSASDAQSGVAVIRYTTDGSVPTLSSPVYTAPFTLSATATVNYRAWDNAGNVEPTKTQLIRIDTIAPTVAITSPANGSTVSGTVKVAATAVDSGGSGIAQVSFYADGVLIGTATSPAKGTTSYFVNWNTKKVSKGQHTLSAITRDAAGNSRTSSSILVNA